jgi:tetratricopeptide (TPR) repeat protein
VSEALSFLWAARRGLAEDEIRDLLGTSEPLPRATWSPLFQAIEKPLVNRGGLLGFAHDHLKQTVKDRYLSELSRQRETRLRLAAYFGARHTSARKLDELPWQLAQAEAWQMLLECLSDPEFAHDLWDWDDFAMKVYWTQLEKQGFHVTDGYRGVLEHPELNLPLVPVVGKLLIDMGEVAEAVPLHRFMIQASADPQVVVSMAYVLIIRGALDEATTLLDQAAEVAGQRGDKSSLGRCLGNQAAIARSRGEHREAADLYVRAEAIFRELNDTEGLARCLRGRAGLLMLERQREAQEQAMDLLQEA